MFTLFDPGRQKLPIKVWLENAGELEPACLEQARNLSNLPFAHGWIALMPDTHSGYGMPIDGSFGFQKCGTYFVYPIQQAGKVPERPLAAGHPRQMGSRLSSC